MSPETLRTWAEQCAQFLQATMAQTLNLHAELYETVLVTEYVERAGEPPVLNETGYTFRYRLQPEHHNIEPHVMSVTFEAEFKPLGVAALTYRVRCWEVSMDGVMVEPVFHGTIYANGQHHMVVTPVAEG